MLERLNFKICVFDLKGRGVGAKTHAPVKHSTELPKRYVGGMGSIPI